MIDGFAAALDALEVEIAETQSLSQRVAAAIDRLKAGAAQSRQGAQRPPQCQDEDDDS